MKNRDNSSHENPIRPTRLGRQFIGATALLAAGAFLMAPAFKDNAEPFGPAHIGNESKLLTPEQTRQLQQLPHIEVTVQPGEGADDVLLRANSLLPYNSQAFQDESEYITEQGAALSDGHMLQSGQLVSVPQYYGPFKVVTASRYDSNSSSLPVTLPPIAAPNPGVGTGVASH